ncbi:unnamed protein product [Cylicocyclus nassatus]|uniref:Uncharacterized protein n=1 Tax=Cylicocyclus nassatus TaxID=53992 RepID=A0AA36M3G6_CYLNA|nr:unnamed protein product [Cylicocyclus nassatus]
MRRFPLPRLRKRLQLEKLEHLLLYKIWIAMIRTMSTTNLETSNTLMAIILMAIILLIHIKTVHTLLQIQMNNLAKQKLEES